MPLTLSVSSVTEVMSAIVFWVLEATSRLARPTLTVSHRNTGSRQSDSKVSGIDIQNIAINVEMITTTLDSTDDAVSVTTVETPPTSLESRDWISPVRVDVKNRKRHVLEMRVERVPQVLHHAEPDEVRLIRLGDPEHAGDHRDDHHQRHPDIDDVHVAGTRRRCRIRGGRRTGPG